MTALRTSLLSDRRSWLLAAGVAVVCLALLLAHSEPGLGHMDAREHGPANGPVKAVMSLCLAVIGSAIVLLGAWGGLQRRRPGFRLPRIVGPTTLAVRFSARPLPAARAGPARLQVFLR